MTVWLEISGQRRRVDLLDSNGALTRTAVDGREIHADVRMLRAGTLSLIVEGNQYSCVLDGGAVVIAGRRYDFTLADPRSLTGQQRTAAGDSGPRQVKAPMPGRVVRVLVEPGGAIEENQGLVVIEAMKMQNELKSPKRGRVAKVGSCWNDGQRGRSAGCSSRLIAIAIT